MTQGCEPTLIQSVQRALRVLETVASLDGRASAKRISRITGIPRATTYHLLRTLLNDGYVQRLADGTYVLGDRMDATLAQGRSARAVATARPALEWLRDEVRKPVYLAEYTDGEIVIEEIVDSPRAPRIDLWVGIHDSAHATALGKCILAHLDDEQREDYLSRHPLQALTPNTVIDRGELRRVLRTSPGLATDQEEYALGVRCAALPVVTRSRTAAIGYSTSSHIRDLTAAAGALAEASRRVGRALALV